MRDAPVNGPSSSGRPPPAQQAIFWGGTGSPADKAFSFEDLPLDALLGCSGANNGALPQPLVPMEVRRCPLLPKMRKPLSKPTLPLARQLEGNASGMLQTAGLIAL